MPHHDAVTVHSIYRYPVKGLSPEPLVTVSLNTGQTLPADRRYAIENGPSGFDPVHPKYFPKNRFLMLTRNERLASLQTRFDDDSHTLTISHNNVEAARGDLETTEGRAAIENFFAGNFSPELHGAPKVLSSPSHSFSDVSAKVVSIINLASVAAIEDIVGQPVHPLRFRGNIYVTGWPAWHEFDLVNSTLGIDDARLRVVERIVRCAAVNVDPVTAARNMNIPHALMRTFGHADCGVYARVLEGGRIASGNEVVVTDPHLF
jgi:uncharacterized protein YcbX